MSKKSRTNKNGRTRTKSTLTRRELEHRIDALKRSVVVSKESHTVLDAIAAELATCHIGCPPGYTVVKTELLRCHNRLKAIEAKEAANRKMRAALEVTDSKSRTA